MKFKCPVTFDTLNPSEVQIYAVKSEKRGDKNNGLYSICGISKLAFIQLECCPITRESIYIPLTLQEYLAVTEQSEGSYIEVDVKVVSAEKFKEKLPSKGEASFLDHAQYAEYIEGLTQGLSSLQKANLASEESWQLLLGHAEYAESLGCVLRKLQEVGLATQKNWCPLINQAQHAISLSHAILKLESMKLFSE